MSEAMTKTGALTRLTELASIERSLRLEKPAAIKTAVRHGCTWIEIAAALGCSRQALYNYRRRRQQEA